jgi:hypothetical protein
VSVTELLNFGEYFGAVLFRKKSLNLSHPYAACVHGDDLVVEACEALLVLRNQERFEAVIRSHDISNRNGPSSRSTVLQAMNGYSFGDTSDWSKLPDRVGSLHLFMRPT